MRRGSKTGERFGALWTCPWGGCSKNVPRVCRGRFMVPTLSMNLPLANGPRLCRRPRPAATAGAHQPAGISNPLEYPTRWNIQPAGISNPLEYPTRRISNTAERFRRRTCPADTGALQFPLWVRAHRVGRGQLRGDGRGRIAAFGMAPTARAQPVASNVEDNIVVSGRADAPGNVVQVESVAHFPSDDVIGARRIARDAERADQSAVLVIKGQAAAKHVN